MHVKSATDVATQLKCNCDIGGVLVCSSIQLIAAFSI